MPNDFVNSETYYISALIVSHYVSKFALYTVNPGKSNVFQESADKKLFVTYTLQRFTNAIRRYTNAIYVCQCFNLSRPCESFDLSRPCQCFNLSRPCQCFDLSRPFECFNLSRPSQCFDLSRHWKRNLVLSAPLIAGLQTVGYFITAGQF